MRVALNATSLLSPLTGIGQYTKQLVISMKLLHEVSFNLFYANGWNDELRHKALPKAGLGFAKSFRRIFPGFYDFSRIVQQLHFSREVNQRHYDLYHEPNFLPFNFKGPTIVTVHDLSWIRYPETHPKERVQAMNKYFEPAIRKASLLLTDSEFVKQELINVFNISESKIQAVALGVGSDFRPRSTKETYEYLNSMGLFHGQYFILVGTIEPRKNIEAALSAFIALPKRVRQKTPLVLVGIAGWKTSALQKQIRSLEGSGEIKYLGYVPAEYLFILVSGACALIYPSLYEGFGLPPLEAMASGVPVIASNSSAIPEVVGDGGILLHPSDVNGFKDAMLTLSTTPEIRKQLSCNALGRSELFSWHQCALGTLDAYKRAVSNS